VSNPVVFVVDDDAMVARSLRWLIQSVRLDVETYPSAAAFLAAYQPARRGCVLLDVRMPGMSGLELHQHMQQRGWRIPVVFLTGHGDVQMAVRAIKHGAFDFVEKPFNDQDLLDRLQLAIRSDAERYAREEAIADEKSRLASLTGREREVMQLVVDGLPNKVIADRMGLSAKTVEAHRARVMEKLKVRSVSDLVKIALRAEVP
jgi:RNA polymerase sigma factor (sigma-70 family)